MFDLMFQNSSDGYEPATYLFVRLTFLRETVLRLEFFFVLSFALVYWKVIRHCIVISTLECIRAVRAVRNYVLKRSMCLSFIDMFQSSKLRKKSERN